MQFRKALSNLQLAGNDGVADGGADFLAGSLATDWRAFGAAPDTVKGGAGISGLYDLEPIRLCYLNDTLKLDPEAARRNSPVHLTPTSHAPLLLPVGALEGPEYHRQSEDLAAAWPRCQVLDMAAIDHFSIICQLETPGSDLSRAILRQMGVGDRR